MEPQHYQTIARIQDTHWFYRHRRELLRELLEREAGARKGSLRILDFGAGTGANLPVLIEFGQVTCVEREPSGIALIQERWPACEVKSDLQGIQDPFDVIVISYVLYHREVPDPEQALRSLRALAKPGAVLINFEPAFRSLARALDRVDHGARRFTSGELKSAHAQAGWQPMNSFYVLPSLFPAAWLLARKESAKGPAEIYQVPIEQSSGGASWLGAVLGFWLKTGDSLLRKLKAPFGVGVAVLSRAEAPGPVR